MSGINLFLEDEPEHVKIVMPVSFFEHDFAAMIGNPDAGSMNKPGQKGALL